MNIKHSAAAGTFESSDVQISVEPIESGIQLDIQSSVFQQYGEQIEQTIREVLRDLDVEGIALKVIDKGALDCTIRSRVETAIFRGCDWSQDLPWGTKL